MKAINKKIVRNLWVMKGQAIAIALVIGSGIATFIMSISTMHSLKITQATFYKDYHFSEVFASLKRAPERLKSRIQEISGVDRVETRVVAAVNIDIKDFQDPVTGHLISIPENSQSMLNKLYLRQGRLIEPFSDDEVIIGEAFAEAHGFRPGDELAVIIKGKRKAFTIVGIALSPEHIYQMSPGAIFPDFERYGVMWMDRSNLATAYAMKEAFNNVVLTLSSDANFNDVIERLDELLKPFGGLGAYARKDQPSHRYLSEEFRTLEQMAAIFPVIFLGVAAFLLNVVINRLITTQREEIAVLKAFGYSNLDIGLHFVKLIMLIVLVGVIGGVGAGIWLGKWMGAIYIEFYRFPFLKYELRPAVAFISVFVSIASAMLGTFHSVRRASLLPPAKAMQPETPAVYKETLTERLGFKQILSQPTRMIIREIERRPIKSLLSVIGIAFACAIMMVGNFQGDAIDFMVDIQFGLSQREDIAVTFVEPTSRKALFELQNHRGVQYGEAFRSVPVRLVFQHRGYRTTIQGIKSGGDLLRLLDSGLKLIELPPSGIVITDHLGKILGVRPGDQLTVEVLEGSRPVFNVPVVSLVSQFIGISGYMELSALNRLMLEGNAISGVYLATDSHYQNEVYADLKKMPRIAGTEIREKAITSFYDTMGETILIFTSLNTLLACIIAFAVVYNSARISFSERSRELASLRVLGFTRGEISYILLGELGMLTLAAIPLGFLIGRGMCAYIADNMQTDLFRVPLILEPNTYAFAASVVLASASISCMIMRYKLDRLDLIAVLKTKE